MKKLLLTLFVLLSTSLASFADFKVTTYIKTYNEKSSIFELHITITKNEPGIGDVYVSFLVSSARY